MDYNDIVARIQKGEKIEDIANEMTTMLNMAQEEVRVQEEAKRSAAAEQDAKLNEIADRIAVALQDYLTLMGLDAEGLTGTEVRDMLDEFAPLMNKIKNLKVKIEKTSANSPDDVFSKWFKMMNW